MRDFKTSPIEMLVSLWKNRDLILVSTKRDIKALYQGSFFGLLWVFLTPLFMLAVFTFVFSVIFQARWGGGSGSKTEFALLLFAGLIIFNLFAECITRAPGLVLANTNYVKKIVFPLEILPIICLLTGLFRASIGFLVWLIFYLIFFGAPFLTVFYLPLLLIPFSLILLGLSWSLASLGVYLRDISQLIGVITTTIMFLSPIFYPVEAFPRDYQIFLHLNPITFVVEQTRNVLFWGQAPDFVRTVLYWIVSLIVSWLGFVWFQKTRKGFSDVL